MQADELRGGVLAGRPAQNHALIALNGGEAVHRRWRHAGQHLRGVREARRAAIAVRQFDKIAQRTRWPRGQRGWQCLRE
jgi:hypothetical protein